MANVRDYLKKRKERKEGQTRISYREKIRSHKFMIFYRTVLVILLAVGVSAALYIQWTHLFVDRGQMKSSVAFYNFGPVGKNNVNN